MPQSYEALVVLLIILPGFLTLKIKELFTGKGVDSDLYKIMESLAYSAINALLLLCLLWTVKYVNQCLPDFGNTNFRIFNVSVAVGYVAACFIIHLLISVFVGIVWGIIVAKDLHYQFFRKIKATNRTGRIDVWADVFSDIRGKWLLVTLKDGTRVLGWAQYYSDTSQNMQLFLRDACYVANDGRKRQINGPGILIPQKSEIMRIEFMD